MVPIEPPAAHGAPQICDDGEAPVSDCRRTELQSCQVRTHTHIDNRAGAPWPAIVTTQATQTRHHGGGPSLSLTRRFLIARCRWGKGGEREGLALIYRRQGAVR
jgi:hypothetical protein